MSEHGFANIIVIVIGILAVVILLGGGYFLISQDAIDEAAKQKSEGMEKGALAQRRPSADVSWFFRYEWEHTGTPPSCPEAIIKVTPVNMNLVTSILYPGQSRGGHYKAHGGFGFENSSPTDVITVRVPQDGEVVGAVRYIELGELQYLFDIHHPCGIRFRFDHLRTLSPKFQKIADALPPPKVDDTRGTVLSSPVKVNAGEVMATAIAFKKAPNTLLGIDFGVYDLRKLNQAAQNKTWLSQHWGDQAPYALCWLDFLPSSDKQRAKSLPCPGGSFTCKTQSDYCK